jgi:N-formylglutamate deformylase
MFEGRLPSYANTRSLRVAGGLGTIAKVVGESQEIYNRRLTVPEGLERIERLYKPYHRALRCRVQEIVQDFGLAVLIDCHSMPSASLPSERHSRPDIVLGDRYGTSCSPVLTDVVEHTLRQMGYRVHRNKPYAGGYITESYGNPQAGMHALQIEINRALYMDEAAIEPTAGLKKLNADFALLCDGLLRLDLSNGPYRAAAE